MALLGAKKEHAGAQRPEAVRRMPPRSTRGEGARRYHGLAGRQALVW